ncbi:MAG: hypothetical protein ACLRTQ_09430 [Candidatus Borkfalkia sp.]
MVSIYSGMDGSHDLLRHDIPKISGISDAGRRRRTRGTDLRRYQAIIMAGVALILLVFNLIRSFFPMRG